jgi:hypothetical protein
MYEWVLRDWASSAGSRVPVRRRRGVAPGALQHAARVADKRWFLGCRARRRRRWSRAGVGVDDLGYDPEPLRWLAWSVTVFAGLTMVSNVRYWSFKSINLKKSVPFVAVIVIAVVIGCCRISRRWCSSRVRVLCALGLRDRGVFGAEAPATAGAVLIRLSPRPRDG